MRTLALAAVALASATSIAAAQAPGQTAPGQTAPAGYGPPPSAYGYGYGYAPAAAPAPAPQTETVSYRTETLLADGLSLALMVAGPAMYNHAPELSSIGFTGYLVAAPLIHLAHGRTSAAGKSLLLRVGLPLVGGLAGYKLGPQDTICADSYGPDGGVYGGGCSSNGSLGGLVIGVIGGGLAAMALDTAYLARYERPVTPTWTASFQPTRGGATVGIAGSF